jgi:hypothetical protein
MAATKARFSFFKLPPELRNRVYELVLGPPRRICVQMADGYYLREGEIEPEYGGFGLVCVNHLRPPPITQVSRQVRAETTPIHYGQHTFVAYVDTEWHAIYDWEDSREVQETKWHTKDGRYMDWLFEDPLTVPLHKWLKRIGTHQASLIKHLLIRLVMPDAICTWKGKAFCKKQDCGEWHPTTSAQVSNDLGLSQLGITNSAVKAMFGATIRGEEWKTLIGESWELEWTSVGEEELTSEDKTTGEDYAAFPWGRPPRPSAYRGRRYD